MGFFNSLFNKNNTTADTNIENGTYDVIDDTMLLGCKGVNEETLENLSDNKGDDE